MIFPKLNWRPYIVSIAKTNFKKIGALICFLKFVSFYKSTIRSCMEYCSEAVAQSYSAKKVFLEILPNSHENTCASVSFLIKLQFEVCNKHNFSGISLNFKTF